MIELTKDIKDQLNILKKWFLNLQKLLF